MLGIVPHKFEFHVELDKDGTGIMKYKEWINEEDILGEFRGKISIKDAIDHTLTFSKSMLDNDLDGLPDGANMKFEYMGSDGGDEVLGVEYRGDRVLLLIGLLGEAIGQLLCAMDKEQVHTMLDVICDGIEPKMEEVMKRVGGE